MARIRADYVFGTTTDDPLLVGATTLNSAELARLPVVTAPDVAAITLHDATAGTFEIVHVTAHTASATSATILRAQEGSTAQEWPTGTTWLHGMTVADATAFIAANGVTVQDENGNVATGVTQLDFQGAGVTAAAGTGEVVVTIPGGSASEPEAIGVALSDETTAITTGTAKATIRMPFAMTLTAVRASLTTASSSGLVTVDVNEGGASILSTKLTIDASEKTSTTAATAAVISDSALADDAEVTFDIDTAGTGAAGLKVWLIGTRA